MTDLHAVFMTLADGTKHRVSDWMDWDAAIERWTAMDDQRRESVRDKGMLAIEPFPGRFPTRFEEIKHYEVRSENDPNYAGLPEMNLARHFRVLSRSYTTDIAAAKAVLKPLGYFAKEGGWVYWGKNADGSHSAVAQGWVNTANQVGHRVVSLPGEKGYRAVVTIALQVAVRVGA